MKLSGNSVFVTKAGECLSTHSEQIHQAIFFTICNGMLVKIKKDLLKRTSIFIMATSALRHLNQQTREIKKEELVVY